jgi:hypothetical protein
MSAPEPQPSLDEQRALYAAAVRFKEVAPWQWMYDSDLFGVQDPNGGETGYCCITGNLGEHLALVVYQGSEGLAGLAQMRSGRISDPMDLILLQKCLMASFEDRAQLTRADLDTIKALGLKFRGSQEWPQFRSYLPGFFPWYLTRHEAQFLTLALQQASEVALRYRDNRRLLTPPRRGQFLVRVPEGRDAGLQWHDAWVEQAPPEAAALPAAVNRTPIDEARLRRIAETAVLTNGVLEMDFFLTPSAVADERGGRPYYPFLVMAVDQRSGFVFGADIVKPDEVGKEFVESLIGLIERMGKIPGDAQVCRHEAFVMLAPVAEALGIRLRSVRRLRSLDEARQSLTNYLG